MINNSYTAAIDSIHISESAIEAALAAAKRRAAGMAARQLKIRYAAVAASVVLAGTAGALTFGAMSRFEPPLKPAPAGNTVSAAAESRPAATEAIKEQPTSPATTIATAPAATAPTTASKPTDEPRPAATEKPAEIASPTEPPAPTAAPEQPTELPTQAPPADEAILQSLADNIDSSLLCSDGKLYMAIAETGLTRIDDPEAFSDEHVYFIDTKFGRYYLPEPFELKPVIPSWIDQPKSDEMVYLYNSDGEIIGQAPIWW